jgi:hypothetical protein
MSAKPGRILLPDGMEYRLLVLPDTQTMTPRLLRTIRNLVAAGANILGNPPQKSPSLSNYPECDDEVRRLVQEIWGASKTGLPGQRAFGQGQVFWGYTPREVLARNGLREDFAPVDPSQARGLRYTHRRTSSADIFFVANLRLEPVETLADFRVRQDLAPELWNPDSGQMETLTHFYKVQRGIRVPLRLDPGGSVFVVFTPRTNKFQGIGPPPFIAKLLEHSAASATRPYTPNAAPSDDSSFTMAVWARPEADTPLPQEANTGENHYMTERNDALFPPPFREVGGTPDIAGAGLAIGRNGVCVYEHAAFYFPPILVAPARLTNWTHVAVVYKQGRPSLFLNGEFVREGQPSAYVVRSGVGVQHRRGIAPYRGMLGEFRGADHALSPEGVRAWMNEMPIPFDAADMLRAHWTFSNTGKPPAWVARKDRQTLSGPWTVQFDPESGGPGQLTFSKLVSWSEHSDPEVRHYSGAARYFITFDVLPEWLHPGARVFLDLGKVAVTARARLNGQDLGVLWKPPYELEVTSWLRASTNRLEVEVVNLWVNRMIGDEALPPDCDRNPNGTLKAWPTWLTQSERSPSGRFTFSTWPLWKANEPLRESGLLGPVQLVPFTAMTSDQ